MESSYSEAYVSDWRDGAFYLNRKFGQGSASNSGIPRPMRIKGDSSLIRRYSERFSSILRGEKKMFSYGFQCPLLSPLQRFVSRIEIK